MSSNNLFHISDDLPAPVAMLQMMSGYWVTQSFYIAAKLGIADRLKEGPKPVSAIAAEVGVHERSLYRVLRGLTSVGVFEETSPGQFALNERAECLATDTPGSLRGMAILYGEPWHWRTWERALDAVKGGTTGCELVHGALPFDYFAKDPEASKIFDSAMTGFTAQLSVMVPYAFDFSGFRTLVDVGGGHGNLLAEILKANPEQRAILFDQASVIAGAGPELEQAGVADRCERIAGDFFQSVPRGGDAYLLKNILHDWPDDRALTVLRNCQQAMEPGSKLLVIEMVVPEGPEASLAKLVDLEMMVFVGGAERTESEYRSLFDQAGFELTGSTPIFPPFHVVEGVRR